MVRPIHLLTACHNNLSELKGLIASIKNQTHQFSSITVVDDGSTDGTYSYLSKHYPSITVIHGNGKLWWTGSLNLGIRHLQSRVGESDYLLTINADCHLPPNYLQKLAKYQDSHAIVGSHIVDHQTKKTWDLGERLDWRRSKIFGRKNNSEPLDALTTKGTLYPFRVFRDLGLFSSRLPHYGSDYEFTIRAKRAGYKLILAEDCYVYNMIEHTGLGDALPTRPSYRQILFLMFGRRSKLNLIDHFWLIALTCPSRHLFINYLRLLGKAFYLLVLPLPILHRLLRKLRGGYNA